MNDEDARLAELILHVARQAENDPTFGAVKLNKILFWADFLFYLKHRRPISGQPYMRLKEGPVPRRSLPVQNYLKRTGALAIQEQPVGTKVRQRPVALRPPVLDQFTVHEIAMVDSIVGMLWGKSAREVSDMSHEFAGWKAAQHKETIPYGAVLQSDREPSAEDRAFAKTLVDVY